MSITAHYFRSLSLVVFVSVRWFSSASMSEMVPTLLMFASLPLFNSQARYPVEVGITRSQCNAVLYACGSYP